MTDDNVRLIMAAHGVDEAAAKQILEDIASGKRKVATAEELRRRAGPGSEKPRLMSKSTRPVARLVGEGLDSLDLPSRGAGRKDNGREPRSGDRAAKDLG